MSKRLVTYFSASGVTAKVAENLADAIGADIFEIQLKVSYTKADLNWMDKKVRSTIEMSDPASRPAIAAKRDNIAEYDTIFVGYSSVKYHNFSYPPLLTSLLISLHNNKPVYRLPQQSIRRLAFVPPYFLLYQLSLRWVKYRAQPEAIST